MTFYLTFGFLVICLVLVAFGNSSPVSEIGGNTLESNEWSIQNTSTEWDLDLQDDLSSEMRIVRGSFAEEGEFPYQVALLRLSNNHLFCGGSIIHPRLILTAAHCLHNKLASGIKVIAGVNDWSLETGQTRNAKFIYNHENYDHNSTANDISLIELDTPLQFNSRVGSINLPKENENFRGSAKVFGWGKTSMHWSSAGSQRLQKTNLPIVPNESCQERYKNSKNPVTSNHLCAGGTGSDTCQGDSGGPAICKRRDSSQVLCGVTSFGIGCGIQGIPGVYARTASYINWIEFMKNKILTREKCRSDYFYCSFGTGCIPRAFLCDSQNDCTEGLNGAEDEQNCKNTGSCKIFQFRCNNGRCLDQANVCNGANDCGDSSDEEKCLTSKACGVGQHQCGVRGRCIPNGWKCDKEQDCDDGSDEDGCEFEDEAADTENEIDTTGSTCPSFFWRCGNGRCIYHRFKCDGDDDCADGSDEVECNGH